MYKVSKFTYCFENKKGELLLYNSYAGVRSFCKLPNNTFKKIFLENEPPIFSDEITTELLNHGIIVKQNIDENQRLFAQFVEKINSSELCLTINVTEQCNFRCKYCYESHEQGEMSKEVQDNIIKFVRENIQNYSALHIGWFGGEPLLAKKIIFSLSEKLINICKFYKRPYTASITTNGYLLTPDTVQNLLKYKVKYYQVTLDGAPNIHNKYRITCDGKNTYNQIINNLRNMKKLNRKDFIVNLRSNITEESFLTFDDYLKDIEFLCEDDERFYMTVFKVGDWLGNAQEEVKCSLIQQEDGLRRIYQHILDSDRKINLGTLFLNPGSGACYAGKLNKYLIRSNGNVHQCTVTFEKNNTQVGKIEKGKLILNDIHDAMLINPAFCSSYLDCKSAPICMGRPCPAKKDNKNCLTYNKYLDIMLQIFDKMNWFHLIDSSKKEGEK